MRQLDDSDEEAILIEDLINVTIEKRRVRTNQEMFSNMTESDKIKLQEKYKKSADELLAEFKKEDKATGLEEYDDYQRKRSDR